MTSIAPHGGCNSKSCKECFPNYKATTRVYTFTYREPIEPEEYLTPEETLQCLKNNELSVEDLEFLARDNESDITVTYSVHEE